MKSGTRKNSFNLEDLDEVDRKIIKSLQTNGRESLAKIAEEMGLPTSTVRDRTHRLLDNDILRVVGVLNPLKARQRIMATIGVKVSSGELQAIADEIAKFDEVSYLVICAGSFDLLVEVICKDNAHLLEFTTRLRNNDDIYSTETFIHFAIVKEVLTWGSAENWGEMS